jgi:hypothetical protein
LNPANTIAPNSITLTVGCFDANGALLQNCCPTVPNAAYPAYGGHNHAVGPHASYSLGGNGCYSNFAGVPLTITTSTAGQAEAFNLCAEYCSAWALYSDYRQANLYYLSELGADTGSNYALIGTQSGLHPGSHFGTPFVVLSMQSIASQYAPSHRTIGINDMSLIYGGVFDINGDWVENNHAAHRKGLSVDVQYRVNGSEYSVLDLASFTAIVNAHSGTVGIHSPGGANQHIHIDFLDLYD